MIDEKLAFAVVALMAQAQQAGWQTRLTSAKSTEIIITLTPQEWPQPKAGLEADLADIESATTMRVNRRLRDSPGFE